MNTLVIEDACQSHLAEWRGRPIGSWGARRLLQFPGEKEPGAIRKVQKHAAAIAAAA